ncbi:MAG: phosphate uptake regulator PhoU [Acidimicrobiaceae bacterium]|nr:phosphate uptake regulator PhoU [Acidimicrobiaceae bacterium]
MELRAHFRKQLRVVEDKVELLLAFIPQDLVAVTEALLNRDGEDEVLPIVAEHERVVDSLYKEVEALVDELVTLQAPVASDARYLLSVLRVVPELERSHDLVVHLAYQATHIRGADLSPRARELVQCMGSIGSDMWLQAATAWYDRDASVAETLDERDDELDTWHIALVNELAAGQLPTRMIMDMTLVARFYERLGDHAVNIGRRAAVMVGLPAPA